MTKILFLFLSILFTFPNKAQQKFFVDLNDRSNDLFHVTLQPENLKENNNIFQFAATAPGTYQIMDIGRYVRSFNAYDENGNEIESKQISANQWQLSSPDKIKEIKYSIAETWDTEVNEKPIWRMAGTSIEDDHALINGQAVFGYFKGMQKYPINIKFFYPDEWLLGTALKKNKDGFFEAKDYNHLVDSPVLTGRLSEAETKVHNTDIKVYTYSKTDLIKSNDILDAIQDILKASDEFLKGLPVEHYTFLFHFEDISMGAWEHSYSSEYVYKETPLTDEVIASIRSTIAHEFFHIVTPLNIHSEVIENFNFETPVLSQHLWLYEAATEWAARLMELRSGLVSIDNHLKFLKQKLTLNDHFDQDISLQTLAVKATELEEQYANIYYKGAVTIEMLDIRLLELSNGERGLREVILELTKKYGPEKSFSEENFFDEFYQITYPEIKDFFERYITGTEKLPLKEYFSKLGINYYELKGKDSSKTTMGFEIIFNGIEFLIASNSNPTVEVYKGDILYKFRGEEVNLSSAQKIFGNMKNYRPGDEVKVSVLRNGEEIEMTAVLQPQLIKHVFELNENAGEEEIHFRNIWMKNN